MISLRMSINQRFTPVVYTFFDETTPMANLFVRIYVYAGTAELRWMNSLYDYGTIIMLYTQAPSKLPLYNIQDG